MEVSNMSKKCWFTIIVLFALGVALVIALPVLMPPTPGVTYANYSRIEIGMPREKVEALLGTPSLAAERGDLVIDIRSFDSGDKTPDWFYWRNEDSDHVQILFDESGRVRIAHWNGWPDERNGLEKLRDRLPWIAKNPPKAMLRPIK
jgi:hypothetical protein